MDARIVLLPGDGIGPEIVTQARRVLEVVGQRFGHGFEMPEHPIGGNAIDDFGDPLPAETLAACGKWDSLQTCVRPRLGTSW